MIFLFCLNMQLQFLKDCMFSCLKRLCGPLLGEKPNSELYKYSLRVYILKKALLYPVCFCYILFVCFFPYKYFARKQGLL